MSIKIIVTVLFFLNCANSQAAQRKFSEQALKKIAPLYAEIVQHPFNQELVKGTLPKEKFDYYSAQDALYLVDFSKALAMLATKLEDTVSIKKILEFSMASLQESKTLPAIEKNPANFHYTNFLLTTAAYKSREETAAALLPCFWIYYELAKDMKKTAEKTNPYFAWIELYASDKYKNDVQIMLKITDALSENVSDNERSRMLQAFERASQFELQFWQDAYLMQK